jgi:hypothetical protein
MGDLVPALQRPRRPRRESTPPGPMPDVAPGGVRTPLDPGLCAVCGRPLSGPSPGARLLLPVPHRPLAGAARPGDRRYPRPAARRERRPPPAHGRVRTPRGAAQAPPLATGVVRPASRCPPRAFLLGMLGFLSTPAAFDLARGGLVAPIDPATARLGRREPPEQVRAAGPIRDMEQGGAHPCGRRL